MTLRILSFLFAVMLACLPLTTAANAQQPPSFHDFKRISILHEGRVKPLDSYARAMLKELSGKENIAGQTAIEWLARALFDPAAATDEPVFLIPDAALRAMLDLPQDRRHFSLSAIAPGLQKTAAQVSALMQQETSALTQQQQELLRLHEDALRHAALLRSVSLILPLEAELPEWIARQENETAAKNFLTLFKYKPDLMTRMKAVIKAKGGDPQHYNAEEQKTAVLAFSLEGLQAAGAAGGDFRVIPTDMAGAGELVTPWSIFTQGLGGPKTAESFTLWQKMADAYRARNGEDFANAAQALAAPGHDLEIAYNLIKPFHVALILYVLALTIAVAAALRPQLPLPASWLVMAGGFAAHLFGIAARVMILERPPVGTLYESVLFVSMICAFLTLLFTARRRRVDILIAGNACAAGLLAMAPALLQRGDSMDMLAAVLNTNFWLATHVLCITAGYGLCIMAACLAQLWLLFKTQRTSRPELTLTLYNMTEVLAMAALLLTAVGTILGGIWADQSWGRFWGWDPKENGALLIVLWLVWLQHGRIAGMLSPPLLMAGIAFLNVIVALAWFGVNLLGVGLHSYGFISGIAAALALFCTLQISVIAALLFCALRNIRRGAHEG